MSEPAKGEFPYIMRFLRKLRQDGWAINNCRCGLVVKHPGRTTFFYSIHTVTGEICDEIAAMKAQAQNKRLRAGGMVLKTESTAEGAAAVREAAEEKEINQLHRKGDGNAR